MWLLADYTPAALFSLRASGSTSSGGRTNLCPTMYSVKMALIAAAFESGGDGRYVFELVKHAAVRLRPSRWAVANNCFIRIQREPHEKGVVPFEPTVAYREFVFLGGDFTVAVDASTLEPDAVETIEGTFPRITYFGKRGSLVQFRSLSRAETLDTSYSFVLGDERSLPNADMIVQFLDDFGPEVTFEAINTYSDRPVRMGRDRVVVPVGLPYRLRASSRTYSWYERTAG